MSPLIEARCLGVVVRYRRAVRSLSTVIRIVQETLPVSRGECSLAVAVNMAAALIKQKHYKIGLVKNALFSASECSDMAANTMFS